LLSFKQIKAIALGLAGTQIKAQSDRDADQGTKMMNVFQRRTD
jgi:hypothetical protein